MLPTFFYFIPYYYQKNRIPKKSEVNVLTRAYSEGGLLAREDGARPARDGLACRASYQSAPMLLADTAMRCGQLD